MDSACIHIRSPDMVSSMRSQTASPIQLPDRFWSDMEILDSLAQRDIGQLFRLIQRASGATQTRVGIAVGLSQAQVSEIMSGGRRVSSVDVLSRIATGLQIPEPARSVLFLGDATAGDQQHAPLQTSAEDTHGSDDIVAVYAMRGLIPRPKWNSIIGECRAHLWLYGMAELGYALDDEVPTIIKDAAERGCDIRVLLLDPAYAGAAGIDSDEGSPPGTLTTRIRSALARYGQMAKACGPSMKIRVYDAMPTVSIVRCDGRLLVAPYLRFFVGSNSPSLELRRRSGRVFDRYVRHFLSTWDQAEDWTL